MKVESCPLLYANIHTPLWARAHTHTHTSSPLSSKAGKIAPLLERLSREEKKLRKTEEDEPRGDSDESASFALSPRAVNRHLFMRINETNLKAAPRLFFFGYARRVGAPPCDAHGYRQKVHRRWSSRLSEFEPWARLLRTVGFISSLYKKADDLETEKNPCPARCPQLVSSALSKKRKNRRTEMWANASEGICSTLCVFWCVFQSRDWRNINGDVRARFGAQVGGWSWGVIIAVMESWNTGERRVKHAVWSYLCAKSIKRRQTANI